MYSGVARGVSVRSVVWRGLEWVWRIAYQVCVFAASGVACLIGLSSGRFVLWLVFHTTGRSGIAHALWHDGRHETSHRLGL